MKLSLFRKSSAGKSYNWTPALEVRQGWMVCTLLPFGTYS